MFACKNKVSIRIADKTKEYCCQAKSNLSNLSTGSERIERSTVLGIKYEIWDAPTCLSPRSIFSLQKVSNLTQKPIEFYCHTCLFLTLLNCNPNCNPRIAAALQHWNNKLHVKCEVTETFPVSCQIPFVSLLLQKGCGRWGRWTVCMRFDPMLTETDRITPTSVPELWIGFWEHPLFNNVQDQASPLSQRMLGAALTPRGAAAHIVTLCSHAEAFSEPIPSHHPSAKPTCF